MSTAIDKPTGGWGTVSAPTGTESAMDKPSTAWNVISAPAAVFSGLDKPVGTWGTADSPTGTFSSVDKPTGTNVLISKPSTAYGLTDPHLGSTAYGFLFDTGGAGSGLANTDGTYGLYGVYDYLWDHEPVVGELGDYFTEGTTISAGGFWASGFFVPGWWRHNSDADAPQFSVHTKPTGTWGLVGKPT